MKQLTVNIEGKALDWALAVATGSKPTIESFDNSHGNPHAVGNVGAFKNTIFEHKRPELCLKVADIYKVNTKHLHHTPERAVLAYFGDTGQKNYVPAYGRTIAEAVARCDAVGR